MDKFEVKEIIKPRRLMPGQTLAVVAPSAPIEDPEQIHAAVETIQSLGFDARIGKHLFAHHGYFAGTDEMRAADLNDMFAAEEVAGIVALRGGYGASRLLPHLDFGLIRRNPKVLIGYSDITSLLAGIYARTGMVTFHGPIADQAFTPYTLAEFKKVLCEAKSGVILGCPPPFDGGEGRVERQNRVSRLVSGKARGRLVGGNLTLISHLVGTPYLPSLSGAILFLEDVHEAVYRIDRMLVQLRLSGVLQGVAGFAFGKFTEMAVSSGKTWQFSLPEVLEEFCQQVGVPAVRGLMIGHVPDQTTLPVGCLAELDADNLRLTLLEAGVT